MRVRRTATSENSAATKNPLRATSAGTASNPAAVHAQWTSTGSTTAKQIMALPLRGVGTRAGTRPDGGRSGREGLSGLTAKVEEGRTAAEGRGELQCGYR